MQPQELKGHNYTLVETSGIRYNKLATKAIRALRKNLDVSSQQNRNMCWLCAIGRSLRNHGLRNGKYLSEVLLLRNLFDIKVYGTSHFNGFSSTIKEINFILAALNLKIVQVVNVTGELIRDHLLKGIPHLISCTTGDFMRVNMKHMMIVQSIHNNLVGCADSATSGIITLDLAKSECYTIEKLPGYTNDLDRFYSDSSNPSQVISGTTHLLDLAGSNWPDMRHGSTLVRAHTRN